MTTYTISDLPAYHYVDDPSDFDSARTQCESINMSLAMPKAQFLLDQLSAQVFNSPSFHGTVDVWVGLYDFDGFNLRYTWLDGTDLDDDWAPWGSGQPYLASQRCGYLQIEQNTPPELHDGKCSKDMAYICETGN